MIIGSYSTSKTILTPKMYRYLIKGDQALLKDNFLSEFKTNTDKNKVLKNLGISGGVISSPMWGEIKGNIEDQKDLINKIKESTIEDLTAEQVSYTNYDYPNLENVKKALDELLHKDLTVQIQATPSSAEKGDTVNQVTFTWNYNKSNILYQQLNGQNIDVNLRTYTINKSITNNISYSITGTDGVQQVTAVASLIFYYGIYYINSITQPLFENCKKTLSNSLSGSYTVDAKDNEYIWFLIPTALGTPTFTVGIFSGGFYKYAETTYKNISYNIYRSDNHSLGKTTINLS